MKARGFVKGLSSSLPIAIIAALISIKFHLFIYVWLIYVTFSVAGTAYGASILRKENLLENKVRMLFWSNAGAWIIPPIGIFTAS